MNTNKKLQITKVQTQKGSQTVGVFLRLLQKWFIVLFSFEAIDQICLDDKFIFPPLIWQQIPSGVSYNCWPFFSDWSHLVCLTRAEQKKKSWKFDICKKWKLFFGFIGFHWNLIWLKEGLFVQFWKNLAT